MKKIKKIAILMCLLGVFCCAGCGGKELPSAKITRDDARTGGSLSFVYDKNSRMVYVGGQDEIVQFSSADDARNLEEGCRIGLKITAPDEQLDVSTATLEMNGINYSSGDFLEIVNGQKQRFFNLYPLVSKDDEKIIFSITWQDGTEKQIYTIEIIDGTKFMDKDGNVL